MLTLKKLRDVKERFDDLSPYFHKCVECKKEFSVLRKTPKGSYIICDDCKEKEK